MLLTLKRCLELKHLSRYIHMTSICRSKESFYVQDEDDFQKQVIESRKLFLVDFQATW